MKWMLFMIIMGMPTPMRDMPPFDTESGCQMAKHSIEMKVGPNIIGLMNLTCVKMTTPQCQGKPCD